jgi:class 3 adenylate cyclase/tetratricopeptide (TPR) repeat protein
MEPSTHASGSEEAVLVGRRAELARLEAALEQAAAGRPRIVLLRGEAGIGKSRLLRALGARARARGMLTGVGHAQEAVPVPYLAFAQALQGLAPNTPDQPAYKRPHALLRSILKSARAAQPGGPGDPGSAQQRIELVQSLVALGSERALLFAVDDVHWADDESLQLLGLLGFALSDAAARGGTGVLLVLAGRPLGPAEPRNRAVLRLAREPACETIDLTGLDLLDTAGLLRAEGLARPSPSATQALFENTGGNPLFIIGLLSLARRHAGLETFDPLASPLPSDLSAVVSAHIDAADDAVVRLLRRGALIGSRFSLSLLAQIAGSALEPLIDQLARWPELVRIEGETAEFAHPLIRHELLRRIPQQLRARLHAEIAAAIAARPAVDEGDPEFAHHLLAAGAEVDPERRRPALRLAAQRLEAMCAFGEAAKFYAAAAADEPEPRTCAELHYCAARCHQRNYDTAPCLAQYASAEAAFRELDDASGVARVIIERARLELYTVQLGRLRDLSSLEQALEQLPPDAELLAGWLYCALADAYFYARKPEQGEAFARRALDIGQRHRDHRLCCYACAPLALSLAQSMRYIEAETTYGASLGHGEAGGGASLELIVPRSRRAGVRTALGRLSEARADCAAAITLAARTNEPGEQAFALAQRCCIEACAGHFDACDEVASEMLRLLGRVDGRPWVPLLGVPSLAYARHVRGQSEDACLALAALREPGRFVDKVGGAEHVISVVLEDLIAAASGAPKDDDMTSGRRARVERYAQRISVHTADGMGLASVCALSELAVHYQLPWALEGPREVLAQAFDRGAVLATGWPFLIPRVLGNAYLALGDIAAALRHYEAALHIGAEIGALPELATTRVDYARALLAQPDRSAGRRSRELVAAALDAAATLGMEPLLRRASNLAASLGVQASAPPRAAVPPADLRFWQQLTSAESYGELSERYLLSTGGLRARAGSVFERLGAQRPLDAAAQVIEQGGLHWPPRVAFGGVPLVLLVTDLQGFTPLVERLGDAAAQGLMRDHNTLLRTQLRDHGGLEITHTGDGLIACFRSVPEAIGCAMAIQHASSTRNAHVPQQPLHIRIGLHAGDALLEEGRLFGAAVIAAVRICALCEPGHIVASEVVQRASGSLQSRFIARGARALKGFAEAMTLFDVRWHQETTA